MYEELKSYCKQTIPLTDEELGLIDIYFEEKRLKKKEYLLEQNQVCDFLAFLTEGAVRHFHIKDGDEKTCDISFVNSWLTDFQSFNQGVPGKICLQALEESRVILIRKKKLVALYHACNAYETFGRIMAERVAQRATDIAMSLSADKPEERFQNLLKNQPDIFQRVPQKYIANFLGVSPESLSRIKNRIYHKEKS